MNHYCTYFDRGFLIQGLALWRSLAAHDPDAALWVLALDDFTAEVLREVGGTWMRVVRLAELEAGDPELAAAKANRTRVEYFFTLSPCWPRWLLQRRPEIERVTYLDADLFFFGEPAAIFEEMEEKDASVAITAHRFPAWLAPHYERHGKFNVGILSWRRDEVGLACLETWRRECLAWCHDRLEAGKYADQKYLEAWPERWGEKLLVLDHPGVNAAPWNWAGARWEVAGEKPTRNEAGRADAKPRVGDNALHPAFPVWVGAPLVGARGRPQGAPLHLPDGGQRPPLQGEAGGVRVNGQPLVVFHFARFRPLAGTWWWQSGQLDYGVMPHGLRGAIYGAYWRALAAARAEIAGRRAGFDFPRGAVRFDRAFWRSMALRAAFGSDWLRVGDAFVSGRLGFGQMSGRALAALRRRWGV